MGIDEAILTNKDKNPFPSTVTTRRGTNIRVFVGRKNEMIDIGKLFRKISDEGGIPKMIILEGESGVGKTTLFKKIFDLISCNDLSDFQIHNFEINIAWIEAPQAANNFTFEYIYTQAIQGFSNQPAEFGEDVVKRIIKYLYKEKMLYKFNPEEKEFIDKCYSNFFNRDTKVNDFFKLDFNQDKPKDSYYYKFCQIIRKYKRQITKYLKDNEIDFKFFYKYIETIDPNEEIANNAKDDIEAETIHDQNFLKTEEDYKAIFKNIINIYKWIHDDKNVALIIGIDSFELFYIDSYNKIFSFFLNIRNSDLKNFILFCIGTDQFWNDFRKFLEERKSGEIQFRDLIGLDIKLDHLSLDDTINIIRQYLEQYYRDIGQELGENSIYPFNSDAIDYLYKSAGKNIRTILIKLRDTWDQFVSSNKVPLIQNYFDAMLNFRGKEDIELSQAEIDILYNHFNDISYFSTYGGRSTQVEQGLVNLLKSFKEEYPEIAEVHNKSKEIEVLGQKLRPDVYFIIFGALGEKEQRGIEIQVKMYESSNLVKESEAATSIKLLQNYKTDYLHFLTTSALHEKLKERLIAFGQRIGGINPLNKSQIAYLTLILPDYFVQIFNREPTNDDYKYIFTKIFTFSFDFFLEYMRLIPRNKSIETLNPIIYEEEIKKLRNKFISPPIITPETVITSDLEVAIPSSETSEIPIKSTSSPPEKIPIIERTTSAQIDSSSATEEIKIEEEDIESLIPEDHRPTILHILMKMHSREDPRYKNRATLSWLKKELANDFQQNDISAAWKWLIKCEYDIVNVIKTSILINEKSEKILKKHNNLL